MNFELTEEQRLMRETARSFARDRIAPLVKEDEKAHRFRPEIVREMGELGFFGAVIDEAFGGTGAGFVASVLMTMEIAQVSASWGLPFNMQTMGPGLTIQRWGTQGQKSRYIPGLVTGDTLGCFAITEPNTGSDVASMLTEAKPTRGGFILNGQKTWISQAHVADIALVYAITDRSKKHSGISCFIVDMKKTPGIATAAIEDKFGLFCAPTGEIFFQDAFVPEENLLGKVNEGFKICMSMLDSTRLSCAARAVAVGKACLDEAARYSKERVQFGKPISSFQMVQADLVQMFVEHEAARLLVLRAAASRDTGNARNSLEVSTAKYFAAETAVHAANTAMKILGSYGFSNEYPVGRLLRDAKSFQIVEGTSNIQKMIIARNLLETY
ncbi:MAG: acyl-CoA dehydrogenase family protein [Deltaproteobacteria bacterium]|nr:acyl-CoA dehydrogenase family protein [Deltaproteobacteria bacterium]